MVWKYAHGLDSMSRQNSLAFQLVIIFKAQTKKPIAAMQTIDDTTASINQSAMQIVCGNYDQSINELITVISTIKNVLSEALETKVATALSQQEGYLQVEFLKTSPSSNLFQEVNHRRMPIFRKPIVARCSSSTGSRRFECLSFVAMYNLALTYHLQFEDNDDTTNVQNLHKAHYLYEYAYGILKSQEVEVSTLHLMALTNNLATVHRALGDEEKADLCLQQLLSLLMYVIDCGHSHELEDSLDGFVETVLPLIISGADNAPAA